MIQASSSSRVRPPARFESVDGGFHRPFVRSHQPVGKMIDLRQMACRSQTFESIDQLIALAAAAHHHRR
jgi:hypothetical protein